MVHGNGLGGAHGELRRMERGGRCLQDCRVQDPRAAFQHRRRARVDRHDPGRWVLPLASPRRGPACTGTHIQMRRRVQVW